MHRLAPPDLDPLGAEAPLAYVFSPLVGTPLTTSAKFAVVAKSPLTETVQRDLVRLWTDKRDYLAGLSTDEKLAKLKKVSYKDYLVDIVKVHPDVLKYFHPLGQPPALTTPPNRPGGRPTEKPRRSLAGSFLRLERIASPLT